MGTHPCSYETVPVGPVTANTSLGTVTNGDLSLLPQGPNQDTGHDWGQQGCQPPAATTLQSHPAPGEADPLPAKVTSQEGDGTRPAARSHPAPWTCTTPRSPACCWRPWPRTGCGCRAGRPSGLACWRPLRRAPGAGPAAPAAPAAPVGHRGSAQSPLPLPSSPTAWWCPWCQWRYLLMHLPEEGQLVLQGPHAALQVEASQGGGIDILPPQGTGQGGTSPGWARGAAPHTSQPHLSPSQPCPVPPGAPVLGGG